MDLIYRQNFSVDDLAVDCFGRLKPSMLLYYMQEVAGNHFSLLEDRENPIAQKHLFWAVSRHRVFVERLPKLGETVTVETWPMPTTRVAYPRAMAMYDGEGNLLARSISLWVLMDLNSRAMVLPGKSGVTVEGIARGNEPEIPKSLMFRDLPNTAANTVTYSLLDINGHMNNTRYLDWVDDLLPGAFHRDHRLKELTLCYLSEALEGQEVTLQWGLTEGTLQVDAHREKTDVCGKKERVFSAQVQFE